MTTRRLAIELGAVAVAAAIAGTGAARAMFVRYSPRIVAPLSWIPARAQRTTAVPTATPVEPVEAIPLPSATAPAASCTVPVAPHDAQRARAGAHAASAAAHAHAVLPARLTRASAGCFRLDLRGVSDASSLLAGVQVELADDAAGGYAIRARDRGGYLAAAGIAPGDVLEAVNGSPTRNADQALDALGAVHDARAVSLRFRRGTGHYSVTLDVLR